MATNERHIAKIKALGEKKKVAALTKYCKNDDAELRAAAAIALATSIRTSPTTN